MITGILTASLAITGAYFESRTCSIVAGPCHFSGEVMTDGRMAVIAVSIENGSINDVSLKNLEAAVVVRSNDNLLRGSSRESVLFVDSSATDAQKTALISLLKSRSGISFGSIKSVSVAKIKLSIEGMDSQVSISTPNGTLYSAKTNGDECLVCSMPGTRWYDPLSSGTNVSVATVTSQSLCQMVLGEKWTRGFETAAFVGEFRW